MCLLGIIHTSGRREVKLSVFYYPPNHSSFSCRGSSWRCTHTTAGIVPLVAFSRRYQAQPIQVNGAALQPLHNQAVVACQCGIQGVKASSKKAKQRLLVTVKRSLKSDLLVWLWLVAQSLKHILWLKGLWHVCNEYGGVGLGIIYLCLIKLLPLATIQLLYLLIVIFFLEGGGASGAKCVRYATACQCLDFCRVGVLLPD